jgi:hypothetical protein
MVRYTVVVFIPVLCSSVVIQTVAAGAPPSSRGLHIVHTPLHLERSPILSDKRNLFSIRLRVSCFLSERPSFLRVFPCLLLCPAWVMLGWLFHHHLYAAWLPSRSSKALAIDSTSIAPRPHGTQWAAVRRIAAHTSCCINVQYIMQSVLKAMLWPVI